MKLEKQELINGEYLIGDEDGYIYKYRWCGNQGEIVELCLTDKRERIEQPCAAPAAELVKELKLRRFKFEDLRHNDQFQYNNHGWVAFEKDGGLLARAADSSVKSAAAWPIRQFAAHPIAVTSVAENTETVKLEVVASNVDKPSDLGVAGMIKDAMARGEEFISLGTFPPGRFHSVRPNDPRAEFYDVPGLWFVPLEDGPKTILERLDVLANVLNAQSLEINNAIRVVDAIKKDLGVDE